MSTQTAHRAALAASAIVVVVAIACAGSDPMTIEEYAAWCGDFDPFTSVEGQAENWREAEQVLSDGLDHAERISARVPDELKPIHDSINDTFKGLLEFVRLQDGEYDPDSVIPLLFHYLNDYSKARDALSPSTRAALDDADC